jgi:hypothetical protein
LTRLAQPRCEQPVRPLALTRIGTPEALEAWWARVKHRRWLKRIGYRAESALKTL